MTICPNLSDEQVKMAFSKFDTSGDDKLDYREFCEMIRQKVKCFNLLLSCKVRYIDVCYFHCRNWRGMVNISMDVTV